MTNAGGVFYRQIGPQLYELYTHNGIVVGQVYMGNDGQYVLDAKVLEAIKKLMARRWGLG